MIIALILSYPIISLIVFCVIYVTSKNESKLDRLLQGTIYGGFWILLIPLEILIKTLDAIRIKYIKK